MSEKINKERKQIHRCWVIYEHTLRVVIFPVILWFGGIACTGMQVYFLTVHIDAVNASPYATWGLVSDSAGPGIAIRPFWGLTAVLNAYATCRGSDAVILLAPLICISVSYARSSITYRCAAICSTLAATAVHHEDSRGIRGPLFIYNISPFRCIVLQ